MRSGKRPKGIITPVSLSEVYAQSGEYSVKMAIDPRESVTIEAVEVSVRNADGTAIETVSRRWGTKLTLSFVIDDNTPDGVAIIDVLMIGRDSQHRRERFDFWVIK